MDRTFLALVQDFIDETLPLAEAVADAALELGTRWSRGEHPTQLFQRVKSNLHTLKGNSAMMGLQPIQALAHALEDVCARASEDGAWRTQLTSQLLVDGAESLAGMVRAAARGDVDAAMSRPMLDRVQAFLKGPPPVDEGAENQSLAPPRGAPTPPPKPRVPSQSSTPSSPSSSSLPAGTYTPPPPVTSSAMARTPPPVADSGVTTAAALARSEQTPGTNESGVITLGAAVVQGQLAEGAATDSGSESIRVDFHRLDDLLELIGEALITHSHIGATSRMLVAERGATTQLQGLEQDVLLLTKTLRQLKETLMATRLVPMHTLFNRFARYVSRLARDKGQPITCTPSGGDTPIDKTIIDRLGEPLLHIVRNAVAHGIESVEERVAAGKPVEALITLSATYQAERVLISVTDDGRGIDTGAVLAKARSLGYETDKLSHDDALRLIFAPGFSTAKEVSTLSGRGVGLDAVAKAVQALGGSVDVESEPGVGTNFILDLPLTLAVLQGLIIEVDRERFAIPMGSVVETIRVSTRDIHELASVGVMAWRGTLIPVADAGRMLGTRLREGNERAFCMVVAAGNKRRGLLVDRLIGLQEIVVKALDEACGRPEVVSGATILGDGKVALILDATGIVREQVHHLAQQQVTR